MGSVVDINDIRDELNQLPFRDGKREVLLGRISEMFAGEGEPETADQLRQCEQELRRHALSLTRHESDGDSLFVCQELRTTAQDLSWMPEAMNWVSKITTVALEMVLPGLVGLWLDSRWGTPFLAILGFVLGVPLGMWHLIQMTKGHRKRNES